LISESDSRYLDAFPAWLRSLPEDAVAFAAVVADGAAPDSLRRVLASSLNYLFKSLDLIPDGIEDLGFLDDAFVLRVAALSVEADDLPEAVMRLRVEATLVRDFLGADFDNLDRFVRGLGTSPVRGRTVEQIVSDADLASTFEGEVKGWAGGYHVPAFSRDTKNLVKLKSFFTAKLGG
jgi:uncharacterized membrane protein YkvA (DUF1232 family)